MSDIAPTHGDKLEQSSESLAVYHQLYLQAQAIILELQEQLALYQTLISQHQELARVLQLRVSELEQQLVEYQDRLKSEQERSAQFRSALKRCQANKDNDKDNDKDQLVPLPANESPVIESWAVKEVATVPPISEPTAPVPINQKRGLESLAAVKLPQFPPLRRR